MFNTVTQRLCDDHRNIESVLTLIRLQADIMRDDDPDALKLLINAVSYMQQYPGTVHHRQEDLIMEKLVATDSEMQSVFNRLRRQHTLFVEQEAEMLGYLHEVYRGNVSAFSQAKDVMDIYCLEHREHISLEEKILCPYAADTFKPQDWEQIRNEFSGIHDPVFALDALAKFGNPYDGLMAMSQFNKR